MTYLISAPVPDGLNGESKHQAGPRQVTCDRVPENMERICPWLIAACAVVTRDIRDSVHVTLQEVLVASHLMES